MADVYEQNLAQKTSLTTSDFIRVVGSDNVSYKQNMSSVMETMGLKYADLGSFSTQSDLETALNNKLTAMPTNSTAYIRFATSAPFGVFQSSGVTYICDLRKGGSATYASISLHGLGINAEIVGNKSSATWTFQKEPTRAEVDALSAVTTGTITKDANVSSGTLDSASLRKVGDTVFASARVYNISVPANGTFFQIPSGFRPIGNARIYGYLYVDGAPLPVAPYVQPNGSVLFPYSASKTTTQAYFCGSWSVK